MNYSIEQMGNAIKIAIPLIKAFEGLKLKAYKCPAGVWTIGYGHTGGVKSTDIITEKQAEEFLMIDIPKNINKLSSLCDDLNSNELACFISLSYNLTTKSILKLIEHVNINKEQFKNKLLLYCKDINGKELNGLLIRRICERMLFEGLDWIQVKKDLQAKDDIIFTQIYIKHRFGIK